MILTNIVPNKAVSCATMWCDGIYRSGKGGHRTVGIRGGNDHTQIKQKKYEAILKDVGAEIILEYVVAFSGRYVEIESE